MGNHRLDLCGIELQSLAVAGPPMHLGSLPTQGVQSLASLMMLSSYLCQLLCSYYVFLILGELA